jgi:hypothetical protein
MTGAATARQLGSPLRRQNGWTLGSVFLLPDPSVPRVTKKNQK